VSELLNLLNKIVLPDFLYTVSAKIRFESFHVQFKYLISLLAIQNIYAKIASQKY
jgi:hypothetical protein